MAQAVSLWKKAGCEGVIQYGVPGILEAAKMAENIGYHIKNKTGITPSVHVFQNPEGMTHVAVARPSLMSGAYNGKIETKNW